MSRSVRVTTAVVLAVLIGWLGAGVAIAGEGASPGGPKEGIKVHGHWVIEVRNPDGTLATRREFQNALIGPEVLAKLLGRVSSIGLWNVQLGGIIYLFSLYEPSSSFQPSSFVSKNLDVAVSGGRSVVLTGNVNAGGSDVIVAVSTFTVLCPPDTPPASKCEGAAAFYNQFTSFHLSGDPGTMTAPVSVSAGQQIQVTVTISFS